MAIDELTASLNREVIALRARSAKLEATLIHVRASLHAVAVHSVQPMMRTDAQRQVEAIDAAISGDSSVSQP